MIIVAFVMVIFSATMVGSLVGKENWTFAGLWVGLLILNTLTYINDFFNLGA